MALAKATPMGARRFVEFRNGVRMRKGSRKAGPSGLHQGSSGCSRNDAFNLYQNYGIRSILSDWWYGLDMRVEEDAILEFVSAEFSERVELAYTTLEIEKLNMENLWVVFPTQEPACKSNGRSSI